MSKSLALTAAMLLLAGCNAGNLIAPASMASDPSFNHTGAGCPVATAAVAGTPGAAGVALGCSSGQ